MQDNRFIERTLPKILLAGSTEKLQYPLRKWASEQAKYEKIIIHLTYPGYSHGNGSEHLTRASDINEIIAAMRNGNSSNTVSASLKGRNFGLFASNFLACFTDMMRCSIV